MAFWGVALASGPHVNRPMNEEDNTCAWKALQQADAVTANERAVKADRDYIRQCRAQGFYVGAYSPHNMHFLWWAQLFEGRSAESLKFSVRPALGRAFLEAGQPERAEQVFRDDLQRWPRNAWGLLGLQTALPHQNKTAAADLVQRELDQAWKRADTQLNLAWF